MSKYIKCEAGLAMIRPDDPNDKRCAVTVATAKRLIRHALTAAPAADVAPVVHARWEPGNPICPVCGGNKFKDLDADIWCDWQPDFCPNCGAKMDGGADR